MEDNEIRVENTNYAKAVCDQEGGVVGALEEPSGG